MNITIVNGNPSKENGSFDSYVDILAAKLAGSGNEVTEHIVRDMKIHHCRGCFDCWVKTPGTCVYRDDGDTLCRSYIHSDLVVLVSPLIAGFTSAVLKNSMDRLIPLIHPYLDDVDGEVHHLKRYDKYPSLALLLEKEELTDDEDLEIVEDIYRRASINVMSELKYIGTMDRPAQEVANEINSI